MFAHSCYRIVKNLIDLLYFLSQIRRNVTHTKLRRNRIIHLYQLPTPVQGSSSCKRWWRSHSSENQVELRNGGCYSTTLECRRNDRGSQFSHRAESYQEERVELSFRGVESLRPVGAQEWNTRFVQWLDDKPSDYRGLFTRAIASRIDLFISFNVNSFVLEHSRNRIFSRKNSSCYLSTRARTICVCIHILYIYICIYMSG